LSHQSEELGHWQLRFFKPGRYRPLAPAFFQKQKQQTGAKDTSSEYLALGIYAPKIKVVNPFGPKEKVAFQSMMPWQRPANGSLTLWLLILLVAAALVLAGLFWLILRQKGSRNQQRKRPRPSVEYFESMNAVKKELAQGDSDLMEVTVAMSRALRRFVERSLPIPAMERDAEELVRSLVHYAAQRDSVLAKAGLEKRVESLAQMLRYLDSIKFAKVEPHRPRLEEIAQELNSWVQKIAKYTEETSVAA
jgi:hypothetical protein